MKLSDFVQEHGQRDLVARLGVHWSVVSRWASGVRRVPAERVPEIEKATNGAVTRHELRPDIFGPAPAMPPGEAA